VVSALVIPTDALSLSAACAKILRRSPADAGADGNVGDVLSTGHRRGEARDVANAVHLGSSRGPGAISVAREDRSENAAQRL